MTRLTQSKHFNAHSTGAYANIYEKCTLILHLRKQKTISHESYDVDRFHSLFLVYLFLFFVQQPRIVDIMSMDFSVLKKTHRCQKYIYTYFYMVYLNLYVYVNCKYFVGRERA